jgi:hypothetical protein
MLTRNPIIHRWPIQAETAAATTRVSARSLDPVVFDLEGDPPPVKGDHLREALDDLARVIPGVAFAKRGRNHLAYSLSVVISRTA